MALLLVAGRFRRTRFTSFCSPLLFVLSSGEQKMTERWRRSKPLYSPTYLRQSKLSSNRDCFSPREPLKCLSLSSWIVSSPLTRWINMAKVERNRKEEIALGMTLLGFLFSSILYGLFLSQLYTYYKRFPRDSVRIKALVAAIAFFNTVSVVLVSHSCWYYFVTTGNMKVAVWSMNVELTISMVISGIAESFLIYRVWMLSSRRTFLTYVLSLFAVAHFVSGLVSAVHFLGTKQTPYFSGVGLEPNIKIPSIIKLSSAAVCDTGIAIALCYYLQQKRTGYRRTDEIIDYLMILAINSGCLTSIASISCLLTYLIVPKTWVYLALCFVISRLYANTFLSALNTRQILQPTHEMDTPVLPNFRHPRNHPDISEKTPTQVYVITETITRSDSNMSDSSSRSTKALTVPSFEGVSSTPASPIVGVPEISGGSYRIEELPRYD
ncbi:hypothetical protein E1B28_008266 [Marasmius oreades]|uniref:DUF6534 domain-containing protein n=1 Tax=Marasmius oreades TaxID=181124 RepID=A0A9P7US79_9AGAR|nr:uncharacterized protein E1B28_008266 [Marasmius oreades]KAG7091865.1 hypothetical protein E1B28_008266 [Marasmius oreades]